MKTKRLLLTVVVYSLLVLCGCTAAPSTPAATAAPTPSQMTDTAVKTDGLFEPKLTNSYYDALKRSFSSSDLNGLDGLDFNETLLWAPSGELRALLTTLLCQDIAAVNKAVYDKYAPTASEYYIALMPDFFKEGSFTYTVMLLDGSNALSIYYTPGSSAASYSELTGIGKKNIDNLTSAAVAAWKLAPEDFYSLMDLIG